MGGGEFSKSNNWGDVETVCPVASVEIGNLVWDDKDSDGIQDPGEAGAPGVLVELYGDLNGNGVLDAGEPLLTSTTTNSAGYYSFSDSQHGLVYGGHYIIAIAASNGTGALDGATASPANQTGDTRDSDGTLMNGLIGTGLTVGGPGENDHSHDFGYKLDPPRSVTDLGIEKTDLVDPVKGGGTLVYSITVTNHGPQQAHDLVTTDVLPAGFEVIGLPRSCSETTPGTVVCTKNRLGKKQVGRVHDRTSRTRRR